MLRRSVTKAKLYELRWYDIKPDKMPRYLALTAEKFAMRTKHSPLLGFWLTEIGGQNQVVHVWEYDSVSQRKDVRVAVGGDKAWVAEYFDEARTLFAGQNNALLQAAGPVALTSDKGYFHYLNVGGVVETPKSAEAQLVAKWKTVVGQQQGQSVSLWRSRNIDVLTQTGTEGGHSRLLMPLPAMHQHLAAEHL